VECIGETRVFVGDFTELKIVDPWWSIQGPMCQVQESHLSMVVAYWIIVYWNSCKVAILCSTYSANVVMPKRHLVYYIVGNKGGGLFGFELMGFE